MDRVKKAGNGVPTGLSVHFYYSSHTPRFDKGKEIGLKVWTLAIAPLT